MQCGLLELLSPGSSALLPWQVTLPVIDLACPCRYCPDKIDKEWGLKGHDRQQGLTATHPREMQALLGAGCPPGELLPPSAPWSQGRGLGNAKGVHTASCVRLWVGGQTEGGR